MSPNDPRHGTTAGFHQGCRCEPCRGARSRYEKESRLRRVEGRPRSVPALGAQRRIQALMRLGWTSTDIATEAGWSHRNSVFRILKGQKGKPTTWLERGTNDKVCEVYDRLSMRLPESRPDRARTRKLAERRDWPPPLAWTNIDNPREVPRGVRPITPPTPRRPDHEAAECPRCGVRRQVRSHARKALCPDCKAAERKAS